MSGNAANAASRNERQVSSPNDQRHLALQVVMIGLTLLLTYFINSIGESQRTLSANVQDLVVGQGVVIERLNTLTKQSEETIGAVSAHIREAGHPTTVAKVTAIEQRLDRIER